jgi:methylmalonyl-CoA/ethylmalonyl-CoA epimerase
MPKITGIHHIALAVPEIESALAFWRDTLGLPLQDISEIPEQASRIAFLPVRNAEVELVQPTAGDSGVARFLQKHGPGLHHICFEVEDLDGMVVLLKGKGIRLLSEAPGTGAGGRRMIFIHPASTNGVLVELYEASGRDQQK